MSFWTFVFLVVIAGMAFELVKQRNLARMGHVEDADGKLHKAVSARDAELQAEVKALRERVKVLERIVTDEREAQRLSSEIEKLRDE
ncbi:hypothetical protein [Alteraurantiacibacter palmitatis]|uniref:Uncharacterized protein n=1 Tax=Alteraurantiacibacter palmitatis TaxID=2054628 RepID=A0ABV7EA62_9SPHN